MQKKYTSLGLMSGTSGWDDASIINSNGVNEFDQLKINFMNMMITFSEKFMRLRKK